MTTATAKTAADFEAAGLPLFPRADYMRLDFATVIRPRVRAGLPITAPAHEVGEWVYNSFQRQNQRVVAVTWDRGFASASFWRVSVPGYSCAEENIFEAAPNAPFVEYAQTAPGSSVWAPAHDVDPQAENTSA